MSSNYWTFDEFVRFLESQPTKNHLIFTTEHTLTNDFINLLLDNHYTYHIKQKRSKPGQVNVPILLKQIDWNLIMQENTVQNRSIDSGSNLAQRRDRDRVRSLYLFGVVEALEVIFAKEVAILRLATARHALAEINPEIVASPLVPCYSPSRRHRRLLSLSFL